MKQKSTIELAVKDLRPALTGLAKVIPRTNTQAISACVKIEPDPEEAGTVLLTGTDLDQWLTLRLPGDVGLEAEPMLVPLADLRESIKGGSASDHLSLQQQSKGRVSLSRQIETGVVARSVQSHELDEYPQSPDIGAAAFPLDDHARQALQQSLTCCSTDPTRQVLNGALLENGKTFVGTDGRHLLRCNGMALPVEASAILPHQQVMNWPLIRNAESWQLAIGEDWFQLRGETWQFTSRLIEGNYPNWKQVMPAEDDFRSSMVLAPGSLAQLCDTIAALPGAKRENKPVGLRLTGHGTTLLARGDDGEAEISEVPLLNTTTKGPEVTVYVNRDYLTKALRFGLNRVDIIDAGSPLRLRSDAAADGRDLILMPVRVPDSTAGPATPPPPPTQPETKPMKTNDNNNKGRQQTAKKEETAPLDAAIKHIGSARDLLRQAVSGLGEALASLKQVKTEQKATDKEIRQVRSTIRSLQKVEF